MRTFLILAFWYWFYNQLFFLLAAMGFFIIHFLGSLYNEIAHLKN